jgi:TonB family protein
MNQFSALIVTFLFLLVNGDVGAQTDKNISTEMLSGNSKIPISVDVGTLIPLDKKYEELTQIQKNRLNSIYEKMDVNDEPPFPLLGLGSIMNPISKAQMILSYFDNLVVTANISSTGEVNSIKILHSSSKEMSQFISNLFVLTKFKPALCSNEPCSQDYLFNLSFINSGRNVRIIQPCRDPVYPRSSMRNSEEGTTRMNFLISVDGSVVDSKVEHSSGHKNLDDAARISAIQCKFQIKTLNGIPQEAWTTMDYRWKLPER